MPRTGTNKNVSLEQEEKITYSIGMHILKETKMRWKNVDMARIDNKRTYNMVPKMWTIECLKMFKIYKIINFIMFGMENWWVE